MNFYTAAYWSPGGRSGANEDSLTVQHIRHKRKEMLFAAVADGIGGMEAGAYAGGYTLRHLNDWFYSEGIQLLSTHTSKELIVLSIQKQIRQIQDYLLEYQLNNNINMGTTLSLLIICGRRYFTVHIGDSRIYELKGRQVRQITLDDSDHIGQLTRCIGGAGKDEAQYSWGTIVSKRNYLLCTDGFYHALEKDSRAFEAIRAKKREQIQRKLEIIGEHGSDDNRSAIYLEVT